MTRDLKSSDYWVQCMREGEFEKAWLFSDEVLKSGINRDYDRVPRHFQCIWDGTPLQGKRVLVRCYHGLGDTLMFIRYAALVKEIAAHVIVWAQPSILDLLRTVEGIDLLIPLHDGIPEVAYDVDVEIMELPHIFRTTLSSIPTKIPYIHVDSLLLPRRDRQLSVGLVWQAGNWEPTRNVPFLLLRSLFDIPDVTFYILQASALDAGWEKEYGTHPGEFSLFEYAQVIKSLDLLITVDSMPAHLAGAMNVPVWVMLKAEADWRWFENRTDSPWYPSMTLFRQKRPGQWEPVIVKISEALTTLTTEI